MKRKQTYYEIANHHGTTFWVLESELDEVMESYNDVILHPRWQWLKLTGATKVE